MQIKVYLTLDVDTEFAEEGEEWNYGKALLKHWMNEAEKFGIQFDDIEVK